MNPAAELIEAIVAVTQTPAAIVGLIVIGVLIVGTLVLVRGALGR